MPRSLPRPWWLALAFLGLFPFLAMGEDRSFRVGYGLVYSVNSLEASAISPAFPDLAPGAHSSFFYLEKGLGGPFFLAMGPGALNLEEGSSQFHAQYNVLSLGLKPGTRLFPVLGLGAGGCIATLSHGTAGAGAVQSGDFLRNTVFLWMAEAGLGYRFSGGLELIAEARGIGFFDPEFSRLDTINLGLLVNMRL